LQFKVYQERGESNWLNDPPATLEKYFQEGANSSPWLAVALCESGPIKGKIMADFVFFETKISFSSKESFFI